MGVNALKRCLHARQEVCSTLQIVKNIYTGNCTRLSIDFFAADTSLLPTHRVRFGTRDDFEGEACGRDTLLGFGNSLLMHLQKL
jgi:hypothetical protein